MKRGNIDKSVWNSVRRALRKHPEELNYLNNCIGWYMVTKIGHGEGNQNHDTVVLKDLSKEFINNKAKSGSVLNPETKGVLENRDYRGGIIFSTFDSFNP